MDGSAPYDKKKTTSPRSLFDSYMLFESDPELLHSVYFTYDLMSYLCITVEMPMHSMTVYTGTSLKLL